MDVPGVVSWENENPKKTGEPVSSTDIDTIPNRNLLYNFKKMVGHSTIWPQVHASRGCPHNCDYCSLIAAFGKLLSAKN